MRRSEVHKKAAPFDLKAVRERLGMKQHTMAELLKAGQSSIARWESEGSLPLIYREYLGLYEKYVHGISTKQKAVRELKQKIVKAKAKGSRHEIAAA